MEYISSKGTHKGTLVFIHGNSSSSKVFKDLLGLNIISQSLIAVDLPGHGASANGKFNDEDFSIDSYRVKMIEFINGIDDDIILLGNSLGGHIAIEISSHIKRLKGLVIFATPPVKKPLNLEEAYIPIPELQTFFTENPLEADIESAALATVFDKSLAQCVKDQFKIANPKVRKAIAIDAGNNHFYDEYKIFTQLNVPRLVIAGSHDPSVNLNYLKDTVNKSKGLCELVIIENCGHFPSLEKPEEFTMILKRFISEVL